MQPMDAAPLISCQYNATVARNGFVDITFYSTRIAVPVSTRPPITMLHQIIEVIDTKRGVALLRVVKDPLWNR